MPDRSGNETPNTPNVSETELREMKVDELQDRAREAGVDAPSKLRKDELVEAIVDAESGAGGGRGGSGSRAGGDGDGGKGDAGSDVGGAGDAGPDKGRIRKGPESSRSLEYAQEETSPDDDPERAGRSLATTSHEVIRQWAEARNGVPATVSGTEHGGRPGVLRFDFGGDSEDLRHVEWSEWFETFDSRGLNFIYQEERSDGRQSNFFRLENPGREDA